MTAIIYNIRDFQPKEKPSEKTLEQTACEIMGVAFYPNDQAVYESSLGFIAPEKDPA